MAKILFHCGAHKTASTHFQYNLDLNKEYLESKGIKYFKFQDNELQFKAIELRGKISENNNDVNEIVQYIKNKINLEIEGYDFAFISYEGSLGNMSIQERKSIYSHYEELIDLYKIIFDGHEITPVFVTRNYVDYVLSVYKWQLKHGRPCKLSTFIKNFNQDDQRWTKIITQLHHTFSTPVVWTYEEYKKDPNKILYALFNNCFDSKVDCNQLKTFSEKKNSAADKNTLNFYYVVNKLFSNRFIKKTTKQKININHNIIDRYFSKSELGKFLPNCMDVDIKDYLDTDEAYNKEVKQIRLNKFCVCLDKVAV